MSNQPSHILGNFQRALDQLRSDLLHMSGLVLDGLEHARRGLLERDSSLCTRVVADDEDIDSLEMKIDREGLNIIMLYQPVASDLRQVVSTMKVSSNLERVADQAVGIAKRARKMNRNPELPETRLVEPLFEKAAKLLRNSLEAYRDGRIEEALEVKEEDDELDRAHKVVAKQLTRRMEEDSSRIKDYLDLQFIVRFLERIGDHAKNISEDTVFAESAVDIRHRPEVPDAEQIAEEEEEE